MDAKIFLSALFFVWLTACASKEKQAICPSVKDEPISTCRAKQVCESQNSAMTVGMGFGLSSNASVGVNQRVPSGDYNECIDHELERQRREQPK